VDLATLQSLMDRTYGEQDRARGVAAAIAWLTEELGELAQAVRKGERADQVHELGDVLAWVASLANQLGIDLDESVVRYERGCPRCGTMPCSCDSGAGYGEAVRGVRTG
jgi:NTP pyrophosphatase (non-canonical NTP hydrolase)